MKLYFAVWPVEKTAGTSLDLLKYSVQDHMKIHLVASGGENKSNHSLQTLSESVPEKPLRILVSYYYFKDVNLDHLITALFPTQPVDIFLDSGAFSAYTQGAVIGIDDYARYIQKYQHLLTTYANLDVIKNAAATIENQTILERDYGFKPLPVFHVGEEWHHLDQYLERYPYIALGVAGTRSSVYMSWLVQCFKRGHDKAVFHGFGITSWEVMKAFPWYSVDSTSWGRGFRFGTMPLFDERTGRTINMQFGNQASCYAVAAILRTYGFDPADFSLRKVPDRKKVCALGVLSFLRAEAWLQKFWGEITIPEKQGETGPQIYFAEVQSNFSDIVSVKPYLEKRGAV